MSVKKTDMQRLVAAAIELFRTQGYCNTSVKQIADACNLSKASLYHYVSSKQELAVAALEHVYSYFKEQIFSLAYHEEQPVRERLTNLTRALINYFQQQHGHCLMSCLAYEVMEIVPEFMKFIQHFFKEWEDAFRHLLSTHYAEEEACILAQDVVSQMQGAILMLRIYQNAQRLERMQDQVFALLDESSHA